MIAALALVAALSASLVSAQAAAPPEAAVAAPTDCGVTEGSFTWGFKESFRAYISGSIANGEWSTEGGINYETPVFGSDALAGELQLDTLSGELAVEGSMTFTGHDGILDTTISDPELRFEGNDRLVVVVDVTGTTQDFVEVSAIDIAFVTGDLSMAEWRADGDLLVIDEVPLVLTGEGAEAFGTYPAEEPFDPITIELEAGADCAAAAVAARSGAALPVPLIVAAALALVGSSVAGWLVVRARRRSA